MLKTVEELEKIIAERDGTIAALKEENKTATESVAHAVQEATALKTRVAEFEKEKRSNIVPRFKAVPCFNSIPDPEIEKMENGILEAQIRGYELQKRAEAEEKAKAQKAGTTAEQHALGAPAVPQGNAPAAKKPRKALD